MWQTFSCHPVVHIQRTGKRRTVTGQTMRDTVRLRERIQRSALLMKSVESFLSRVCGKRTMPDLMATAEECVRINLLIEPPDRVAKRNRAGLICWFCEHWTVVSALLTAHYCPAQLFRQLPSLADANKSVVGEADTQIEDAHPLSLTALLNH
jgi:hypothetical protein